jgi:cyclase
MNRKRFLKQLGVITAGGLIIPGTVFSRGWRNSFTPLRSNIGHFTGRGGTIGWFATDDAVVVVDSQFENSAQDFLSGISEYGTGPEKILFNTHHHGDHVSGNRLFKNRDYKIIAHRNVPGLQTGNSQDGSAVTAETLFDDEFTLDLGNEIVTARYYGRAHTSGDSVIWFERGNIVHMGDLVFNRWYPFIDTNGGAHIEGWISLLETVADEANRETIFIFGHGSSDYGITGSREDLLYMRDYLTKLLDYTSTGIEKGRPLDEIAAIDRFEEFPNHQSAGSRLSIQSNIEAAYHELTSENS